MTNEGRIGALAERAAGLAEDIRKLGVGAAGEDGATERALGLVREAGAYAAALPPAEGLEFFAKAMRELVAAAMASRAGEAGADGTEVPAPRVPVPAAPTYAELAARDERQRAANRERQRRHREKLRGAARAAAEKKTQE